MALTRARIVDGACAMLGEQGLAGLSMRRLAQQLEVRAGALYYHVANKQDLLVEIAVRILDTPDGMSSTDARAAAHDLRAALLTVRDGAEVVSFALAFRPEALTPFEALPQAFAALLPPRQARWAARALVRYVLGFVAEEQNHANLVGTALLPERSDDTGEAFAFGVEAFVRGLASTPGT